MIVSFELPKEAIDKVFQGTIEFELDDADAVLFWLEKNAAELRRAIRPDWETELESA